MFDPNQAPLITETLLKKRRTLEELAVARSQNPSQNNKKRRIVRGEAIKIQRPEEFVKGYLIRDKSKKKFDRRKSQAELITTKLLNSEKSDLKSTVGFVVRVHSAQHASKDVKRELNKLGLRKKYDGIFMKIDAKSIERLQSLDNYLAYGFVSLKMVENLLHKRSYVLDEGTKKPVQDNLLVEKLWGKLDILCLSDLCHELYNVTDHFDKIANLFLPFSLTSPVGNFSKDSLRIHEDKKGYLGDEMENFLLSIV